METAILMTVFIDRRMAMITDPRVAARTMLEVIKRTPDMPKNQVARNFSFVLSCLWEIHNLTVEPEARLVELTTVCITPEIVELLSRALHGDPTPLIKCLSLFVDYDPALLMEVLP